MNSYLIFLKIIFIKENEDQAKKNSDDTPIDLVDPPEPKQKRIRKSYKTKAKGIYFLSFLLTEHYIILKHYLIFKYL